MLKKLIGANEKLNKNTNYRKSNLYTFVSVLVVRKKKRLKSEIFHIVCTGSFN